MSLAARLSRIPHEKFKLYMFGLAWAALVSTLYVANDIYDEVYVDKRKLGSGTDLIFLFGYPFTGTTATIKIAEELTAKSMASNEGNIMTTADGVSHVDKFESRSIDEMAFPNGPFLTNADLQGNSRTMLVESMCSGFCFNCKSQYKFGDLNDYRTWARKCRSATKFDAETGLSVKLPPYVLHRQLSKAVVTVRSPMSTVVSRFRHDAASNSFFSQDGLMNRKGFLQWCQTIDEKAMKKDSFKRMLMEHGAWDLVQGVPCFSEFIRMTVWYNNLNKLVTGMDVHIIHFEDFSKQLENEVEKLVRFMRVRTVIQPSAVNFHRTEIKYMWFTDEEVPLIGDLIYGCATDKTWALLNNHFQGFLHEAEHW